MPWYCYEDGLDVGWGCCYRSFQNALSVVPGERDAPFPDLVWLVREVHGSADAEVRQPWTEPGRLRTRLAARFRLGGSTVALEPADAGKAEEAGGAVSATRESPRAASRLFRHSDREEYDRVIGDSEEFVAALAAHLRDARSPVILDDGIKCYCLVPGASAGRASALAALIDPHTTLPDDAMRETVEDGAALRELVCWRLCSTGGWMAWLVEAR